MERKTVTLEYPNPAVALTAFLPEGEAEGARPAVIVLPGGGYQICAPSEGAPIAERFAAAGYTAFVLDYSTASTGADFAVFPGPLREAALTVKHLRENAGEYGIDPARVVLFGASAGGHLAMSYANGWDTPEIYEGIAEDPETLRPDACVLLYAAAAPEAGGESRMLDILFGHAAPFDEEELERASVKNFVGPQTPPSVLFHSATDPTVPMTWSLELFQTLQAEGIPSELHIFGSGEHAYGLGIGTPAEVWPELALRFLDTLFTAPETFDRAYSRRLREVRHDG